MKLNKAMQEALQRELMDLVIAKLVVLPHPIFQEMVQLSLRAITALKTSKAQLISATAGPNYLDIRLHAELISVEAQRASVCCHPCDDVDRLIVFGASQSVIKELTGAHSNHIVERRIRLDLRDQARSRTKPRTLDEDTRKLIFRMWHRTENLGLVDRIIVLAETIEMDIYQIWPVLKPLISNTRDTHIRTRQHGQIKKDDNILRAPV